MCMKRTVRVIEMWRGHTVCLVEYSPFYGIEKGAVLQEARQFHDSQIEARKARQVGDFLLA